jgi:hypothetical protein
MSKGFRWNKLEYEFGSATKLSNKAKHIDTSKKQSCSCWNLKSKIKIATGGFNVGTHQQSL